jgi:DNA polymerase elongation subunit (family B)
LYEENPQLFFEYNCKDAILVHRLDKKLGLINLIMYLSYFTKINYDDVASPVKTWDVIIANRLIDQGIVVPFSVPHTESEHYEGAYVKEVSPGRVGWNISVDADSLYPTIIRSFNIGPDTYVRPEEMTPELLELRDKIKLSGVDKLVAKEIDTTAAINHNVSVTANGEFYHREKEGILSILIDELYSGRKSDKKEMLKAKSLSEQIHQELINRGIDVNKKD